MRWWCWAAWWLVGCAEGHARSLEDGLRASAVARTARDEVVETCVYLAGVAGVASGRGGTVTFGTLSSEDEGWTWREEPADRLIVDGVEVRVRRIAERDVACAVGGIEVEAWWGAEESGAWVRGVWRGVGVDLVHVGAVEGAEVFEAIEGGAHVRDAEVTVRQTARREGEHAEWWVEDGWGDVAIDGASVVRDGREWSAEGKVLDAGRTVGTLVAVEGRRVEWRVAGGGTVPY